MGPSFNISLASAALPAVQTEQERKIAAAAPQQHPAIATVVSAALAPHSAPASIALYSEISPFVSTKETIACLRVFTSQIVKELHSKFKGTPKEFLIKSVADILSRTMISFNNQILYPEVIEDTLADCRNQLINLIIASLNESEINALNLPEYRTERCKLAPKPNTSSPKALYNVFDCMKTQLEVHYLLLVVAYPANREKRGIDSINWQNHPYTLQPDSVPLDLIVQAMETCVEQDLPLTLLNLFMHFPIDQERFSFVSHIIQRWLSEKENYQRAVSYAFHFPEFMFNHFESMIALLSDLVKNEDAEHLLLQDAVKAYSPNVKRFYHLFYHLIKATKKNPPDELETHNLIPAVIAAAQKAFADQDLKRNLYLANIALIAMKANLIDVALKIEYEFPKNPVHWAERFALGEIVNSIAQYYRIRDHRLAYPWISKSPPECRQGLIDRTGSLMLLKKELPEIYDLSLFAVQCGANIDELARIVYSDNPDAFFSTEPPSEKAKQSRRIMRRLVHLGANPHASITLATPCKLFYDYMDEREKAFNSWALKKLPTIINTFSLDLIGVVISYSPLSYFQHPLSPQSRIEIADSLSLETLLRVKRILFQKSHLRRLSKR